MLWLECLLGRMAVLVIVRLTRCLVSIEWGNAEQPLASMPVVF